MKIHGLDLDNSPLISQDKALRYAENVAIGEGNQSYINEDGFNRVADLIENFKLIFNSNDTHIENIGTIPTNIGVVLFCIYGDLDSNVRRELIVDIITKSDNIEINKILYTEAGNDNSLNFSKDRPIHGDYIYNYKNELIVAFTEGIGNDTNETRVINLTTPYGGISEDSLRYKITNISSLNLIPNVEYPQITINVEEGGNLKSGAYQIGIKYKLQDGSYTNYSILSVPVIVCGKYGEDIKPDIEINRKITVFFTKPESISYEYYKLAIVHCIDTTQNCYETEDIKLDNLNTYIISNLINYDTIVLDDIFIKNISYIREQTLVNYNNRLIRGNVQTLDYTSELNDSLKELTESYISTSYTWDNILKDKHFKYNEIYVPYIGYLDYKGDLINIYNIKPTTNRITLNNNIHGFKIIRNSQTLSNSVTSDGTGKVKLNNTFLAAGGNYKIDNLTNINLKEATDYYVRLKLLKFNSIDFNLTNYGLEMPCYQVYKKSDNLNKYFRSNIISTKYQITLENNNKIDEIPKNQYWVIYDVSKYINDKSNIINDYIFWNVTDDDIYKIDTDLIEHISDDYPEYFIVVKIDLINKTYDADITDIISVNSIKSTSDYLELSSTPNITINDFSQFSKKSIINKYVKSFVLFYIEHNSYNAKILSQGLVFPDTNVNNFNTTVQQYEGQFEGANSLRFYSFEYLFSKPNKLNGNLNWIRNIGTFKRSKAQTDNDNKKNHCVTILDTPDGVGWNIPRSYLVLKPADGSDIDEQSTVVPDGIRILDVSMDKTSVVDKDKMIDVSMEYIESDNTSLQNIAGDSFYRIINANINDYPTYDSTIDSTETHEEHIKIKGYCLADLENPNDELYSQIENQKLQIASAIYSLSDINKPISLIGDFYTHYLTLRLTTPSIDYAYGLNDKPGKDSNNTVYRWILTFPIESRFNLNARYGANIINKPYFLHNATKTQYLELLGLNYKVDNFINTSVGKGYNTVYNENGVEEFEYYDEIPGTSNHPHRIIRSLTQSSESVKLNWRTFKTDDYKDLPFNRGKIISLKTDNKNLYIQQQYGLHILQQRDQLNNDDANNSYLGTSDLFNMEPKEIVYSPSGYIGCESYFDTDVNVSGYVVIDAVHKKIFLINGDKPLEISNIKTREHFEKFIDSSLRNPYNKQGRIINYNEDRNILYITQISPHLGGTKTMSFSPLNKTWVSFHTYIPDLGFVNRNGLFWCKNGKLYQPNSTIKGKYFGTSTEPSVIQFILNESTIYNKLLKTIVWKDQVSFKGNDYIQHFFKETINHIMVHNFDQCSGKLNVAFNESKEWWNGDTGTNKINLWRFNKLFDLVKPDNTSLFMKDVITPDPDKLKVDYKWYDVNRFICQFIYLTLWCNNTNDHEWELIDVHPEWQLDNRNDQAYNTKENNQ